MNQKVKRDIKDIWLCLNCGERIIPFETGGTTGVIEIALFIAGLVSTYFINIFFGGLLMAVSVISILIFSNGKKKSCPSCENVNIVPATSPAAQKFVKS